jgi:glycosyltransferase involved in cell wall biosynthesis
VAERIRVAFVKFGGLASGGTERWLQMMAANLARDRFRVDYFYCDAAPYVGSDFVHPDTDADREDYMRQAGVNLVRFEVGAKDVTTPTHEWLDTDFWDLFDEDEYDFVQTAKAGPAEYPYYRMRLPVVEYLTLSAGVDKSPNIALSINLSQWQRRQWVLAGGDVRRTDVIYVPVEPPASEFDLRAELGIPDDDQVMGFHQRAQEEIFSPIPLEAFARVASPTRHFALFGGARRYREQAQALGLENVHFLDHRSSTMTDHRGASERISRFLNTLDVFAHGRADGETFGAVLAEAMMHGRPCLSHRSEVANAQPETMGPAGLFAVDVDDYAEKLELLLTDHDLAARLAAKARPHAERYYSLPSCVQRLEAGYERVLGRPGAASVESRPLAYGQSELGFLVAGDLDDPAGLARHVVCGNVPDEAPNRFVQRALGPRSRFDQLGAPSSLLWMSAAHQSASVTMHLLESEQLTEVTVDAELNNWERRLRVTHVGRPEELDADDVAGADLAVVDSSRWAAALVGALLGRTTGPPVLVRAREAAPLSPLQDLGYRRHAIGKWTLLAHPERHSGALDALAAWRGEWRRLRIERIRCRVKEQLARVRSVAAALLRSRLRT